MKQLKTTTVTSEELRVLNYALYHKKGELCQPANDDSHAMDIVRSLYDKGLVSIDFDNDRVFINENGKQLCSK